MVVVGHLGRLELLTAGHLLRRVAVECARTCRNRRLGPAVLDVRVREPNRRKSGRCSSSRWLSATTCRRHRRATCPPGSGRLAPIWRGPARRSSSAPFICITTPSSRTLTTSSSSSNSSKSTIRPRSIRSTRRSPRMFSGKMIVSARPTFYERLIKAILKMNETQLTN